MQSESSKLVGKYDVLIKPSALKEIESLPKKTARQLVKRIGDLRDNPRPPGSQKLSTQERYRLRQGTYRIVYAIDDARRVVEVVKVAHRKDVYR